MSQTRALVHKPSRIRRLRIGWRRPSRWADPWPLFAAPISISSSWAASWRCPSVPSLLVGVGRRAVLAQGSGGHMVGVELFW